MVEIKCDICKDIMFACKHLDKFITKPSLVICKGCEAKGELIPKLMAKYSLIEKQKKIREKVKQEIPRPKQEVNEEFIFTLLLSENVRRLVNRFAALKEKILAEEPTMSKKVENCISKIMSNTERQVTNIIGTQAKELTTHIEREDKANQSSINKLQQFRVQVRNRIKQLRLEDSNGEEGPPIFDIQEMVQSIQVLNNKINSINGKHVSLGELINDARTIMTFAKHQE